MLDVDGLETFKAEAAALIPELSAERRRHPVYRTSRTQARQPISPYTRKVVYARDNFRCVWCGKGKPEVVLTLDHHPIPWSAGGSDEPDNLRTLCWDCNETKSNFQTPDELFRRLPVTIQCTGCLCDCCGNHQALNDGKIADDDPRLGPAFCYWHLQPTVGVLPQFERDWFRPWHQKTAN